MTETTSDDRTVHHETIVIDRRFAASPLPRPGSSRPGSPPRLAPGGPSPARTG